MSDYLMQATGITKHYAGVEALGNAEIRVKEGEIVALLGGNGAGKSTLVRILAGVQEADSGEVCVDGRVVRYTNPHEARRAGIETVYQDLAVADNLDVTANLFLGREEIFRPWVRFLRHRQMREHAEHLLESFGISGVPATERLDQLSGGQRQIVAICRAAAWGSRLVILDEPTAALGVRETKQVLDFMARLRDSNVGVIWVSHNIGQVFEYADRVTVMSHGRTICDVPIGQTSVDEVSQMIVSGRAPEHLAKSVA